VNTVLGSSGVETTSVPRRGTATATATVTATVSLRTTVCGHGGAHGAGACGRRRCIAPLRARVPMCLPMPTSTPSPGSAPGVPHPTGFRTGTAWRRAHSTAGGTAARGLSPRRGSHLSGAVVVLV